VIRQFFNQIAGAFGASSGRVARSPYRLGPPVTSAFTPLPGSQADIKHALIRGSPIYEHTP